MRVAEWLAANPVWLRERARQRAADSKPVRLGQWLSLGALIALYLLAAHWLSRPYRPPWDARSFLLLVSIAYLASVSFLTPASAAAAISGEREAGTWQALQLTALRPAQIIVAKGLISLTPPFRLLAVALPLLWMGRMAGRLPWAEFGALLLVLAVTPIAVVSGSLWFSARCRRTQVAMALAYTVTGVVFWIFLGSYAPMFVRGENLWWYANPIWQVAILCVGAPRLSPMARPLLPEWTWFTLGGLLVSALFMLLLTRRIATEEGS